MENKTSKQVNNEVKKKKVLRKFQGVVVSDKMDKTVVVKVTRVKLHPKYGKRFQVARKFHVHDPKNEYHPGDLVEIQEVRPLAKTKRWKITNNNQ